MYLHFEAFKQGGIDVTCDRVGRIRSGILDFRYSLRRIHIRRFGKRPTIR